VADQRAAVVDLSCDAVEVVLVPLEDELAHVNTVDVDNDLDAVSVEDVAGDEETDAKLLARFGLDVDYFGLGVSIFPVSMFFDGATVHEDGRLELGEKGMRGHDERFGCGEEELEEKVYLSRALPPNKRCCWGRSSEYVSSHVLHAQEEGTARHCPHPLHRSSHLFVSPFIRPTCSLQAPLPLHRTSHQSSP